MRYHVQPVGEWHSIEEIRSLAINDKGLKLGDIADVNVKPGRLTYARHLDQRPAVAIDISKERSANLVEVGKSVMAEVDRIRLEPELKGIQIYALGDQATAVQASLRQLAQAGLEGTLLSIVVLFFFLRDWPSTLMVSLAIPICFIITLGCLQMFGMTLNILSMMGLLLAVGMLVDNAVVVVESIYHYREKYPDKPWYCAVQGTQVVGVAIAAGTLSSIIVFLPMVFGEKDNISIFLTQVAIAMAIAHLASWLVAVSLVPMLSARLPPPKFIGRKNIITRVQGAYERFVGWTLESPPLDDVRIGHASGHQRDRSSRAHEDGHVSVRRKRSPVHRLSSQRDVSAEGIAGVRSTRSRDTSTRTAKSCTSPTSTAVTPKTRRTRSHRSCSRRKIPNARRSPANISAGC